MIMRLALGISIAACCLGQAQALTVDNFDSPDSDSYAASAPLAGVRAGNSSGGFTRAITSTTSANYTDIHINAGMDEGIFAHGQVAGAFGSSQLTFDLRRVDATDGGLSNAFSVFLLARVQSGTQGGDGGRIGITVADATTASASTYLDLNLRAGSSTQSYVDFVFADFVGIDFSALTSVSIEVDGSKQANLAVTLDRLCTITSTSSTSRATGSIPPACNQAPEPASWSLIVAGLIGFRCLRVQHA